MAPDWRKDVFSLVKSDHTGNHLTFGMKTDKLPFHFQDVKKVWGRQLNRLIDLFGAVIQGTIIVRRTFGSGLLGPLKFMTII